MTDRYLTTSEASQYLGGTVPAETLKQWRSRGKGPRYVRFPNGKVRYRPSDLDEFVRKHLVVPSEEAA